MGSFTNTLFQGMMDWVRVLISAFWSSLTPHSGPTLLNWIADHWIALFLGLCVIGLVADGLVYLFRWKPYKVWASFFRRLQRKRSPRNKAEKETGPVEGELDDEEAFAADMRAVASSVLNQEGFSPEEMTGEKETAWGWERPTELRREDQRVMEATGARGYRETDGQEESLPEEMNVTSRFEQAIRPRRRRARVTNLFSEEPEKAEYQAPQELIDRREAYRRPVYPRNWKGNSNQQS